jgi:hypothetical protein
MRSGYVLILIYLFTGSGMMGVARGQNTDQDTSRTQKVRRLASQDTSRQELVFDDIEVKGKVEKPGVIIIPKRLEPELSQVELERSFEKEMKDGIGEIPKPTRELKRVDRVESIKKAVERKRK